MVFYYEDLTKKYKLLNIVISIISLITLAIGMIYIAKYSSTRADAIMLIFIIMIVELLFALGYNSHLNMVAADRQIKAGKALFDNCDPEEYVIYINERLKTNTSKNPNQHKYDNVLKNNMCLGLIELGEIDRAIELGNAVIEDDTGKKSNVNIYIKSNLVDAYIDKGDMETARHIYDSIVAETENMSDKNRASIIRILEGESYRLNIQDLSLEDRIDYYKAHLESAETNCMRTKFAYALGILYKEKNDLDKSKEYLEISIEKGNKLYIVEKAKEILVNL